MKPKVHRRGGAYSVDKASSVCTWHGEIMDRECLKHIVCGDLVRIRLIDRHDEGGNRYVKITRMHKDGHLTGVVKDPYSDEAHFYCDICDARLDPESNIFGCNGQLESDHDYQVCEECYKTTKKCSKGCNLKKTARMQIPFRNGTLVTFKRNNIIEIPNWSKNTECFGEMFGTGYGYMITV